jgi:hydrogenase maturation protease
MSTDKGRAVVIGLGSEYRRDDAIGVIVARRVVATSPSTVDLGPIGEPLELLNRWDGATIAVVIDAMRSGSPPGTLNVLNLDEDDAAARIDASDGWASTHGLNVLEVYRLAQVLGSAPSHLVLVGIEGARFENGFGLSPLVDRVVGPATELVLEIVASAR